MFAQKLDFIMNLTNTHNIDLARTLEVDASAVSRLRSGQRKLPKGQGIIAPMSLYFAHMLTNDYQIKTISDVICPGSVWPKSEDEAAVIIAQWLVQGTSSELNSVQRFIDCVSSLVFPTPPAPELAHIKRILPANGLYYGVSGIQQAFIDFLEAAISARRARKIYLFTDECTEWLKEDSSYRYEWVSRIKQLISFGCAVEIIYNTFCPVQELIGAVCKWLPLYMTNAVDAYYYPKTRDEIYHRTIFVVDGVAAMQATSVSGFGKNTMTHLVLDPDGVNALKTEFLDFLSHCKPFMEVTLNSGVYCSKLLEHDRTPGNFFLAGMIPSLFTMPQIVAERISHRSGNEAFAEICKRLNVGDLTKNDTRLLCELIAIPSKQQIENDEIPVGMAAPLGFRNCFYTANEYSVHLKSVSEFVRRHKGYRFALTDIIPNDVVIYCKENEWAIITKCSMPCISFSFDQPQMVSALSLYLRQLYSDLGESYDLRKKWSELMKQLK